LEAKDRQQAGSKTHAERVSVYAVATGDRLGFDLAHLIALKTVAEVHDLGNEALVLAADQPIDETSCEIVSLCEAYVSRRFGFHGQTKLTYEQCIAWLKNEAGVDFDARLVEALLSVQDLIQPLGS